MLDEETSFLLKVIYHVPIPMWGLLLALPVVVWNLTGIYEEYMHDVSKRKRKRVARKAKGSAINMQAFEKFVAEKRKLRVSQSPDDADDGNKKKQE